MNSIQETIDNGMCTGCSACVHICPHKAISIEQNYVGFFSASVNTNSCIECGVCRSVCPSIEYLPKEAKCSYIYYGWNNNDAVVSNSTSGGAFYSLIEKHIGEYIIYGCFADYKNRTIRHTSTEEVDLHQLMKSKYAQSNFYNCIAKIKAKINEGKKVFFCGTPCQCYGISTAIPENESLILIDFICHGVPSSKLLFDYLENEYRDVIEVDFRDKSKTGWNSSRFSVVTKSKKYAKLSMLDKYMYLFYTCSINPACSDCAIKKNHVADITIGDYWGYAKSNIDKAHINKGVSLIIVNSDRGKTIIEEAEHMTKFELSIKDIEYLKSVRNHDRKKACVEFYEYYKKNDYVRTMKKYASNLLVKYILRKLRIGE